MLREHGLIVDGVQADGKIHRCAVEGKKRYHKDGSYLLHLDANYAAGGFQNFCNEAGWVAWHYRKPDWRPSPEEERQFQYQREQSRRDYKRQLAEERTKARKWAKEIWKSAEEAPASHPYAQRKQLDPVGLRLRHFNDGAEALLVPMYNKDGKLVNLQHLHADKEKPKHGVKGGEQLDTHYWVNPTMPVVLRYA